MKPVALRELSDLLRGKLPRFLTQPRRDINEGGYLPVFTFHTLEPDDFDAKLRHLQRNGYRTVTADDALAHLRGEGTLPDRAVMLTIDDGRLSTWTVGLPLLRRYGMVATAFVVPGYTREGQPRPTLDEDPESVRRRCDEITDRQTFCCWSEIEAMHASGHVQIESHTMLHRRVCVTWEKPGWLTPDYANNAYLAPMPVDRREAWPADLRMGLAGLPMPLARPVLGLDRALDPPRHAGEACLELVRRAGVDAFFAEPDWRRQLQRCYEQALARDGRPVERELLDVQAWELGESRRALQERLGKPVRHLCFPESSATARSMRLAADAGYAACFHGLHDARRANRPGTDPRRIGRLKHDYILSLPGEGRRSLLRILSLKAARRLSGRTGF